MSSSNTVRGNVYKFNKEPRPINTNIRGVWSNEFIKQPEETEYDQHNETEYDPQFDNYNTSLESRGVPLSELSIDIKSVGEFLTAYSAKTLYERLNPNFIIKTAYIMLQMQHVNKQKRRDNNRYQWRLGTAQDSTDGNTIILKTPIENIVSIRMKPFIFPRFKNLLGNRVYISIDEIENLGHTTKNLNYSYHFAFSVNPTNNPILQGLEDKPTEFIFNEPYQSLSSITLSFSSDGQTRIPWFDLTDSYYITATEYDAAYTVSEITFNSTTFDVLTAYSNKPLNIAATQKYVIDGFNTTEPTEDAEVISQINSPYGFEVASVEDQINIPFDTTNEISLTGDVVYGASFKIQRIAWNAVIDEIETNVGDTTFYVNYPDGMSNGILGLPGLKVLTTGLTTTDPGTDAAAISTLSAALTPLGNGWTNMVVTLDLDITLVGTVDYSSNPFAYFPELGIGVLDMPITTIVFNGDSTTTVTFAVSTVLLLAGFNIAIDDFTTTNPGADAAAITAVEDTDGHTITAVIYDRFYIVTSPIVTFSGTVVYDSSLQISEKNTSPTEAEVYDISFNGTTGTLIYPITLPNALGNDTDFRLLNFNTDEAIADASDISYLNSTIFTLSLNNNFRQKATFAGAYTITGDSTYSEYFALYPEGSLPQIPIEIKYLDNNI